MKIGDILLNEFASMDNPIRKTFIINKDYKFVYVKTLDLSKDAKFLISDINKYSEFKIIGTISINEHYFIEQSNKTL